MTPQKQLDRLIKMFNASNEGLWVMDMDGNVSFHNPDFYKQFDINLDCSTLSDWERLIHPEDLGKFQDNVENHICYQYQGEQIQSEYRVRKKCGNYCWISSNGVMDFDGQNYMAGCHRDVTLDKERLLHIQQLAYYDQRTGLPNVQQFKEDCQHLNHMATKSLLVVNVEGLYSLFNLYGISVETDAGGRLLSCLKSAFSVFDATYYSLTFDTYIVLLPNTVSEDAFINRIQHLLRCFDTTIKSVPQLSGLDLKVGGAQFVDKDREPVTELIRKASKAGEFAKLNGKQRWALLNNELESKIERRLYIEKELASAILNHDISIQLQPIYHTDTGQIRSFEALARWEESACGPIFPDEFIPVAERKGLIGNLGLLILEQACHFIEAYNRTYSSKVKVNVNVSVLQLLDSQFPDNALDILRLTNVSLDCLVLEITESVILDNNTHAEEQLQRLANAGFTLAMDDFGSGYSSIIGFLNMPFNQIKLDREFVTLAMNSTQVMSYLNHIIELCKENGIHVTIEGIENKDMLEKFLPYKAASLQGYLLSRPQKKDTALRECKRCFEPINSVLGL